MKQPSRTTGHTALTTPHADEQLRRTVADPTTRPRQLFAVGVKRGTGPLVITEVAA
ncbi:hypothetical protein [Streptomyces sp. NPDC088115]|uniref:hypothetical protein n=1 Tax=Streptomyces sp. NPDC088115 TaxID=3365824 RepID=UPI00381A7445